VAAVADSAGPVGAFDPALEQAPEVFESIGVDLTVNVTFRMVNDLVRISRFQMLIGHKCIGIDRATSGNVALDFTGKGFLATIRNHSGARMDYGFGCDSAAQACLIAIRLSGKTQIDWSALRSRSFSSFNSTKRASSALAMTISRQRRYGSFCASRGANSWFGFLACATT
jgi:hypothetical protein